jgi:hypothetical protein
MRVSKFRPLTQRQLTPDSSTVYDSAPVRLACSPGPMSRHPTGFGKICCTGARRTEPILPPCEHLKMMTRDCRECSALEVTVVSLRSVLSATQTVLVSVKIVQATSVGVHHDPGSGRLYPRNSYLIRPAHVLAIRKRPIDVSRFPMMQSADFSKSNALIQSIHAGD